MGAQPSLPITPNSSTFKTGMACEEKRLKWEIENFPAVLQSISAINSQIFDFQAGDSIGLPSTWSLFLRRNKVSGVDWVGIALVLKLKPSVNCPELPAESVITIKDKDGNVAWRGNFCIGNTSLGGGWQHPTFVKRDSPESLLVNGSLIIDVVFKMYARSKHTLKLPSQSMEELVEEFQIKSRAQAKADLAGLLQNQVAGCGSDIKIISTDGLEVTVQKCFLTALLVICFHDSLARSKVFAAMLENDMLEAHSGVINLPDISFAALQILLHFFYTGDLLPEWSNGEVIAELTNAAAKYQVDDLLQFLDSALARVCNLQNAGPLLILANQLELEKAEEELLIFMQNNGLTSTGNFVELLGGLESALGTSGQSGTAGVKRSHEGSEEDEDNAPEEKKAKVDEI